ncbi:MAG: amidohydrolase family protein, partial [Chromatiales bacterium]|nr:amidohydrolase family protein [Chromatiales bacterium]
RFYQAGGKIAMGTDAGTPFNMHGDNAQELALMVRQGMSTMSAIIASTAHCADLMGLADRGRLMIDHKADLLVVAGNPLEDIGNVSNPDNHLFVVKNGVNVASNGS